MSPRVPTQPSATAHPPFARPVRPPEALFTAVQLQTLLLRIRFGLIKRWWIIPICLLLISSWPINRALTQPATFVSEATMWMNNKLNLSADGFYTEELTTFMGTQADLLRSMILQLRAYERVVTRFPAVAAARSREGIDGLPFDLEVKTSPKSSVLHLQARGPSPEVTCEFLNELMEEYLKFKKETRQQASYNVISTITGQIKEVEAKIRQQQHLLADFQRSNNVFHLTEHGQRAGVYLAQLDQSLSSLQAEHRLVEMYLADPVYPFLTNLPPLPAGMAWGEEAITGHRAGYDPPPRNSHYDLLEKLHLLKAKRDELAPYLRPAHSKIIRLEQEISGLEKLLALLRKEEEQQIQAGLLNRHRSLEFQIQNLENQYNAWQTNASQANRMLAMYEEMRQEMQRHQSLHDRLLNMMQSVDLNKNLGQEPLSPLAPASSAQPSFTKYNIAAFAVLISILLGMGMILALELFDNRFTTPGELRSLLSIEVVGQIPEFHRRAAKSSNGPGNDKSRAFVEGFRNLRSWLLFISKQSRKPRIILVSSARPLEGKTTVIANLAATLAMADQRVLLIDANDQQAALHKLFKIGKTPGLMDVLGRTSALKESIAPASQAGLHLLPAGETGSRGSELFLDPSVPELLKELAKRYDFILIDSAPILAADVVTSLAPYTDGVLLVVRTAYSPSHVVREALDRLRQRKIEVLGLVFNRIPPFMDYYCRPSHLYRKAPHGTGLPVLG